VFRWNATWFSDWALRFLNLKKCAKIGSKWFGNLKTWTQIPHLETSPKKLKVSKPRLEVLLIIKNFKLAIREQRHFVECSSDVSMNRFNYEFSFWEFYRKFSILPVVGLNLPQGEEPLPNNIKHIFYIQY
jgi:hypothetical protein